MISLKILLSVVFFSVSFARPTFQSRLNLNPALKPRKASVAHVIAAPDTRNVFTPQFESSLSTKEISKNKPFPLKRPSPKPRPPFIPATKHDIYHSPHHDNNTPFSSLNSFLLKNYYVLGHVPVHDQFDRALYSDSDYSVLNELRYAFDSGPAAQNVSDLELFFKNAFEQVHLELSETSVNDLCSEMRLSFEVLGLRVIQPSLKDFQVPDKPTNILMISRNHLGNQIRLNPTFFRINREGTITSRDILGEIHEINTLEFENINDLFSKLESERNSVICGTFQVPKQVQQALGCVNKQKIQKLDTLRKIDYIKTITSLLMDELQSLEQIHPSLKIGKHLVDLYKSFNTVSGIFKVIEILDVYDESYPRFANAVQVYYWNLVQYVKKLILAVETDASHSSSYEKSNENLNSALQLFFHRLLDIESLFNAQTRDVLFACKLCKLKNISSK